MSDEAGAATTFRPQFNAIIAMARREGIIPAQVKVQEFNRGYKAWERADWPDDKDTDVLMGLEYDEGTENIAVVDEAGNRLYTYEDFCDEWPSPIER